MGPQHQDSGGGPETVWNPNWVPDVDLKAIAKALEEDDQFKNETNNTGRKEIPSGEHLEDAKMPT